MSPAEELKRNGVLVLKPSWGSASSGKTFKRVFNIDDLARYYLGSIKRTEAYLIETSPEDAEPYGSQLWHKDLHGRCLRVFTYLCDVTLENGPLCYCPGTQPGGYRETPATTERFESIAFDFETYIGPAGTVIMFDLQGFHRGLKPSAKRQVLSLTYHS